MAEKKKEEKPKRKVTEKKDSFQKKVSLDKKDVIRFMYSGRGMKTVFVILFLLVIFQTFITAMIYLNTKDLNLIYMVIAILFLGVYMLILYFEGVQNYKTNKLMKQEVKYTIDEDTYISELNKDNKTKLNLSDLYMIYENKHLFIFYISKKLANIIPKNKMTEKEISDLKAILRKSKKIKRLSLLDNED